MPRYCAVKVCRNRGGTASRQDNKRISFYPFPLQDKPRLQKWVDNMKPAEWTPERHQYLCSDHLTGTWGYEPLILSRTCKKVPSSTASSTAEEHTETIFELPLVSEIQTAACEKTGDTGVPAALFPSTEPHSKQETDSSVTVLCCEPLGPSFNGEAYGDAMALQAVLGQTFSLVPVEVIKDKPTGCFLEEMGPSDGEHISVYEHSYCRPDTDKDELWSKILSLHAKILELDRREENTMAKIRALENEIALLRRDGAVFKEKQKVLEDCISSVLL
ncbi:LOW QUALITY PROTEIN: THAP domain-containing protein 5 [Acanthochromis polyacanthus]|uniref:LOW QUALITY PROTEIN: THAP domain-containing protein 5 n=1 Tax=Acanthochromis polyacanthus TaxID=80966 RepID=UPI0022343E36|nr:LOW QUALITY PROTEIN: THAP domain-containing protein 5 [Acanthochromis polyacanthus]